MHAAICSNKYTPQTKHVWNRPNSRCCLTKQLINKISSYTTCRIDGTAVVLMPVNCSVWLPNPIQITKYSLVAGSNPTKQKQDRNKQPLRDVPLPWRQWQDTGLSSLISLIFIGDFSQSYVWRQETELGGLKSCTMAWEHIGIKWGYVSIIMIMVSLTSVLWQIQSERLSI